MSGFRVKLYIGDAPADDMTWEFTDPHVWESVRSRIEVIATSNGRGILTIPRGGGEPGTVNVVVNQATKIIWTDYFN